MLEQIAKLVRETRAERGMNRNALARKAGVSSNQVLSIENGGNTTIETLGKVLSKLGIEKLVLDVK